MSSLPVWAGWAIVAVCPLLGPTIAFLVVFAAAALERLITGATEAPALIRVPVKGNRRVFSSPTGSSSSSPK